MAAKAFRCNVHYCKVKYFRILNSILGKIDCKSSEHIITSLVSSFSLPVLLFGTETGFLSKHQQENLANAYNSIFMKIYGTFNKPIITLCQFYSGYLPFKYLLDLRMMNFFHRLSFGYTNSVEILFGWFGRNELLSLFNNYGIAEHDYPNKWKSIMWTSFETLCNNL